jgi:hypothetical protein
METAKWSVRNEIVSLLHTTIHTTLTFPYALTHYLETHWHIAKRYNYTPTLIVFMKVCETLIQQNLYTLP